MNIPHSWVGVALSIYDEEAVTVPKLYRRIFDIKVWVAGGCSPPFTILQLKKIKSNKIFNANLLYLLAPNSLV